MTAISFSNARPIKPLETIVLSYLAYTTILVVIFHKHFLYPLPLLLFRSFLAITLFSLTRVDQNKVIGFIRYFLPYLLLGYLYGETDLFNNLFINDYKDPYFAAIDNRIFGLQPSLEFSRIFSGRIFGEIMSLGYFIFYPMIMMVPLYLYFTNRKNIGEYVSFILINSFVIFYVIFISLPVAGPQYFFDTSVFSDIDGFFFAKMQKIIQEFGERPTGAFPSSHVSICLIVLWVSFKYQRKLFYIALPFALILILSTIYIGAHYAIDVIGGFLVTPIIFFISNYTYKKLRHRPINKLQVWISQLGK